MVDDNFAQTFRRRLAETIAWCSSRPSLADAPEALAAWRSDYIERWRKDWRDTGGPLPPVLRTPELDPHGFEYPATAAQRAEIMERLAETRATILRDTGLYPTDFSGNLAGGRLLLHEPDGTDSSGGSLVATGGFFDEDDAPAWDCWIAFVQQEVERPPEWESRVVSWIPPSLLAIAEDGIDAAPMQCIYWADDTDPHITRLLRAEGFLS